MPEPPRDPRESRDVPDYEIVRPDVDDVQDTAASRPGRIWLIGAALLLVAAAAAWFVVFRGPDVEKDAQSAQTSTTQQPHDEVLAPLGGSPAPVNVPPLDASDAVVRELVRQLTTHPTVAGWLATDGLIRNFTVVTANIAEGVTPERHLRRLRPAEPLAVTRQGDQTAIDPASYHRYDPVAAAAASIDADGAARLYATLKPRIGEAWRDLGHPDTSVDLVVEQAIVRLLRTPVVQRPPELVPGTKGIGYVFANPDLESLSAAQKQLVRMGPENTRTIQRSLRSIALALGIPPARLPQPATDDGGRR